MKKEGNKSGQITLFVIIGIIIVAIAILIYIFYPQIKSSFGVETKNPSAYMQDCLQGNIEKSIQTLENQGGSINPGNYILYKDQKIEYLCYTNEYYKPCVMQQASLKTQIENEISENIKSEADVCFSDMEKSFQNAGYEVKSDRGEMTVELLPKRVVVTFNSTLILTRGQSQRYNSFNVVLNNNLYELSSIAESILNFEARYGNAETTTYMTFYKDLKVEKLTQTDGSKIYILTNRDTGNKFQFATRSYTFPAGY